MTRIGHGLYGFSEAALLTRVKTSTLRSWFFEKPGRKKPVLAPDYPMVDGSYAISFYDLVDAKVAASLRQLGLSMPQVRRLYAELVQILAKPHPFARQELMHDGTKVWIRAVTTLGEERFLEVLKRQHGIPEVVRPFLTTIKYDNETLLASEWTIASGVAVNPSYCFGKPATLRSRRPTRVLAKAYAGNDADADAVAEWYGVSRDEVMQSVAFERGLAA
jgi:uncharacterized protein (DUF433 family)